MLSSANAFNLDQSNILLFDKELNLCNLAALRAKIWHEVPNIVIFSLNKD